MSNFKEFTWRSTGGGVMKWKIAPDKITRYAKTAFGEYIVEPGYLGFVDFGLYTKSGIAWSGHLLTRRIDVAIRRCESHYQSTVKRMLKDIANEPY